MQAPAEETIAGDSDGREAAPSGLPCPNRNKCRAIDESPAGAPGIVPEIDELRRQAGLYENLVVWRDRLKGSLTIGQRVYAERRVRSLSSNLGPRIASCGTWAMPGLCGCGRSWVSRGCRQHLFCRVCRVKRWKRYAMRLRDGFEHAYAERARGEMLVMLTLTLRHSGDLGRDRVALASGWRRFYKALHKRGLAPRAYAGVWEVTPGRDELGHVHAHVVVLWPFVDWSLASRLWRKACPESTRINFEKSNTPKKASHYVSKYMTKGVDGRGFTPEMRADMAAGFYGTRWVFTSRRFWRFFEPCCPRCGVKLELIESLLHRAAERGSMVASALAEDAGVWTIDLTGPPSGAIYHGATEKDEAAQRSQAFTRQAAS